VERGGVDFFVRAVLVFLGGGGMAGCACDCVLGREKKGGYDRLGGDGGGGTLVTSVLGYCV